MMCLMFGVNAYLMIHVGMQRNICYQGVLVYVCMCVDMLNLHVC